MSAILAWCPRGFLWGGHPRPQPDPLVGLGLVPNPSRTGASGAGTAVRAPLIQHVGQRQFGVPVHHQRQTQLPYIVPPLPVVPALRQPGLQIGRGNGGVEVGGVTSPGISTGTVAHEAAPHAPG